MFHYFIILKELPYIKIIIIIMIIVIMIIILIIIIIMVKIKIIIIIMMIIMRLNKLNQLIHRSLSSANIPSLMKMYKLLYYNSLCPFYH